MNLPTTTEPTIYMTLCEIIVLLSKQARKAIYTQNITVPPLALLPKVFW